VLEYLDAENLTPANITPEAAQSALEGLKQLHDLGICHLDTYHGDWVRNAMLLKNGQVKWVDFELSRFKEREFVFEVEWAMAEAALSPGGSMFQLE
jgi:tRNA A-37 threonylcarbamoyl transferase component Bud32